MRFFNTAGPVNPEDHYCLPPLGRLDLDDLLLLIAQKKYFVLHAPRQTGKTSLLLALRDYLNEEGNYHALYINIEAAQAMRENVKEAMMIILSEITIRAEPDLGHRFLNDVRNAIREEDRVSSGLYNLLTTWAKRTEKPIVLFIDEIDSLIGDSLISTLRQLRSGYDKRPDQFPQSIILCGVRDVRDYRIHSSAEKTIITGGSAFNVRAESLRMGNFNKAELEALYQQHTTETGQAFTAEALDFAWTLTGGQPWLINALGYEVCFKMKENRDRNRAITVEMLRQAKENLILRRETHLDQLADKLDEARVQRIIAPILAGEDDPEKLPTDDLQYVYDLGLITLEGQIQIANKIYQEVIPRELTYSTQLTIAQEPAWYIAQDGSLDIDKLLTGFQQFFRRHSESWVERFDYKEAGPQLLLQAFLQRIINGGGRIEREYGFGRGRTDLLLTWFYGQDQVQEVVFELKIRYGDLEKTIYQGLVQTWEYMDQCGTDQGHLVIFDRAPDKPWDEKIFRRERVYQDQPIIVWGM
ncbi:MAG: ATP-binding protein [Chloroflexota bacterium]